MNINRYIHYSRINSYNTLPSGSISAIVIDDFNKKPWRSLTSRGRLLFTFQLGIISVDNASLWAAVSRMDTYDWMELQVWRHVYVVSLSGSVCIVDALHKCDSNWKLSTNKCFEHSGNVVNGRTWTVMEKNDGFQHIWVNGHGAPLVYLLV